MRIKFKNEKGKTLVGILHTVKSKAIIIMAHGFTGDKISRGRFEKLANAFNEDGFDAIRFDFTGCGESDSEYISVATEVDDLKAAIKWAKATGYQYFGLYGHSLGSLICMNCYSPEISAIVMSGACTGPMRFNWLEYFGREKMQELAEKNYLTVQGDMGSRKEVFVAKQMLEDFEQVDQSVLLKNIYCPVLIIHGDDPKDREEIALLENSKKAMQFLTKESKLEIIPGANHTFLDHLDMLISSTRNWFCQYLKKK